MKLNDKISYLEIVSIVISPQWETLIDIQGTPKRPLLKIYFSIASEVFRVSLFHVIMKVKSICNTTHIVSTFFNLFVLRNKKVQCHAFVTNMIVAVITAVINLKIL